MRQELIDHMKEIVAKVQAEYTGGHEYFDAMDMYVKSEEDFIVEVIDELVKERRLNIVSEGEFGMILLKLYSEQKFKTKFDLAVFKTVKNDDEEKTLCFQAKTADNGTGTSNYMFVDDSIYSGDTYRNVVKEFRALIYNPVSPIEIFAFYNGSKIPEVQSLYDYYHYDHKYTRTLYLPIDELVYINRKLTYEPHNISECFGENDRISYQINFENGYFICIELCGVKYEEGGSNLPWSQAVLYDKDGREVSRTEPEDRIVGTWLLSDDNDSYCVHIRG